MKKTLLVGNCRLKCVILQQPACLQAIISFGEAHHSVHNIRHTIKAAISPNQEKEGRAEETDTLNQQKKKNIHREKEVCACV